MLQISRAARAKALKWQRRGGKSVSSGEGQEVKSEATGRGGVEPYQPLLGLGL